MKRYLSILFLALFAFSACNNTQVQNIVKPGGNSLITVEEKTADSVTLKWEAAKSTVFESDKLRYKVYYSLNDNISDASDVETNGTAVGSYQENITSRKVDGLTKDTKYYFNVLVWDNLGNNKLVYKAISVTTEKDSTPTPPGPTPPGPTPPGPGGDEEFRAKLKADYYTGKHKTLGYDGSTGARRYLYGYIDNHNNQVTGVYGSVVVAWPYGSSGTNPAPINCEHTVPQSFFDKDEPMKSDLHHLFPTYGNWNSSRSNNPFKEIPDSTSSDWLYLKERLENEIPTENIDLYSETGGGFFEPPEAHKGNVARAIFYFYTMYPNTSGGIAKVVDDVDTLWEWHNEDPVDAAEKARNERIETYQGDLNPYIVHPEYVQKAWGFSDWTGN